MPDKMSDDPVQQQLFNWFLGGVVLECQGSITAIVNIDVLSRDVTLQFRDGFVDLSYDYAIQNLKEALI